MASQRILVPFILVRVQVPDQSCKGDHMRSEDRRKLVKSIAKRDAKGALMCFYCEDDLEFEDVTLDHYIPLAAGGTWDKANLRNACQPCNNRKSNLVPDGKRHPVPAPRPKRKTRMEKTVSKASRVPCEKCWNGRVIPTGSTCADCGREGFPEEKSHLNRARLGSCSHVKPNWCMICLVYPELVEMTA